MGKFGLSFDTSAYDGMPISTFIYEPAPQEGGGPVDFRVVYANDIFARDWKRIYHNENYIGALLRKSTLMDEYSLNMMESFLTEKPYAFSTYMPLVNLHLHFEPMVGLEKPYQGFFITNLTDYEEKEAKIHFLKNVRQMKNTAVLMQIHEYNRLEAVFVSDDFAEMMECSVEEAKDIINGSGFVDSTHPEDRPLIRSMLKHRVSDDGGPELTVQKVTAKGRSIWCNVHFAFIDDFNEHYVYCTYTDVTAMKEYEERLRSVYVNMGNTYYQLSDKTLGLARVNLTRDLLEDIKGPDIPDCDFIGKKYSESVSERTRYYPIKREQKDFLDTFDIGKLISGYHVGRTNVSRVLYSIRPNGKQCFVKYSVNITRHPMTGEIIAFVTEQECNNEKVNETLSMKILAQQFDMVSYVADGKYGVVIGDSSRIKYGSIFPTTRTGEYNKYVEKQILPVLAGTEERKTEMLRALAPETIARETHRQEPYVVNIAIEMDGETYHKRIDFYTVDPEANFYILLKSDTTAIQKEQQARNDQLRMALEEAKQANVAKTAFLSSMSHEIRTPMNAIIGIDKIALMDPDISPRTKEQLEKIGGSAHHLLSLINDILDMSRIESGRMVLKNEEFSFRNMLEQINTMISSQCQDRGLTYECKLLSKVDDYYIGDDMKLKQVLINILGNSVKFTPAPGTVSFIIERTAQFGDQSTLKFVMKDTGIGMDADYLPKIFEAFSQEDATTTNKYGGSGLGMAITKNIVEMMNGNITVKSEKGVGSEFTVNVTLKNTERNDRQEESSVRIQDMNVLVIDDDEIACEHAKIVMEEVGVAADTCLSGKEAVEMIRLRHARREAYDLILVDLRMPEENGVDVTRQIRGIVGNESAVIMLTAYDWTEFEEEAIEAGVDSFLHKPLFASTVMEEFTQAIGRKQQRHPDTAVKAELEGRKILLAEDMFINAEIMKELLGMREMSVDHAENGKIAVDMFKESEIGCYDAVLMDVRMPVMDGLQATEAIRALDRPDAKTVPIIAMTANAFDEDVQRSLQAGMTAHLSKPVEPDHLYETLSELIGARQ